MFSAMYIQANNIAVCYCLLNKRRISPKLSIGIMPEQACFEYGIGPVAPATVEVKTIERHFLKQRIGAAAVYHHQHHVLKAPCPHAVCVSICASSSYIHGCRLWQSIDYRFTGIHCFAYAVT